MTTSCMFTRQPLDLLIDQFTQSVERAELKAGINHERDRELLKPIDRCECAQCAEAEPCLESPDVITLTDAGVLAVCGDCQRGHSDPLAGPTLMLYKMPDSELAEWGRVR
jgi:hypothetical protein